MADTRIEPQMAVKASVRAFAENAGKTWPPRKPRRRSAGLTRPQDRIKPFTGRFCRPGLMPVMVVVVPRMAPAAAMVRLDNTARGREKGDEGHQTQDEFHEFHKIPVLLGSLFVCSSWGRQPHRLPHNKASTGPAALPLGCTEHCGDRVGGGVQLFRLRAGRQRISQPRSHERSHEWAVEAHRRRVKQL